VCAAGNLVGSPSDAWHHQELRTGRASDVRVSRRHSDLSQDERSCPSVQKRRLGDFIVDADSLDIQESAHCLQRVGHSFKAAP